MPAGVCLLLSLLADYCLAQRSRKTIAIAERAKAGAQEVCWN
jgi:hypothetical protein